jgi:hypothetical protein
VGQLYQGANTSAHTVPVSKPRLSRELAKLNFDNPGPNAVLAFHELAEDGGGSCYAQQPQAPESAEAFTESRGDSTAGVFNLVVQDVQSIGKARSEMASWIETQSDRHQTDTSQDSKTNSSIHDGRERNKSRRAGESRTSGIGEVEGRRREDEQDLNEKYKVGDEVEARVSGKKWYPAVISSVSNEAGIAVYQIEYDLQTMVRAQVQRQHLRLCSDYDWCASISLSRLREGDRVHARYRHSHGEKVWFPGVVISVSPNDSYSIHYDDNDTEKGVKRRNIRSHQDNLALANATLLSPEVHGMGGRGGGRSVAEHAAWNLSAGKTTEKYAITRGRESAEVSSVSAISSSSKSSYKRLVQECFFKEKESSLSPAFSDRLATEESAGIARGEAGVGVEAWMVSGQSHVPFSLKEGMQMLGDKDNDGETLCSHQI